MYDGGTNTPFVAVTLQKRWNGWARLFNF